MCVFSLSLLGGGLLVWAGGLGQGLQGLVLLWGLGFRVKWRRSNL